MNSVDAPRVLEANDLRSLKKERALHVRSSICLGYLQDSTPLLAPTTVLCGELDGPVLWVQATIHGAEIGGTAAILRLIEQIELSQLAGTVVLVPTVNPAAFRQSARTNPLDSVNMNRAFPGSLRGSFTEQACSRVLDLVQKTADCVLDLHSGGSQNIVPHYGIYHDGPSDASHRARDLAQQLGLDILWASSEDWLEGALFTVATQAGIPGLIVESGGGTLDDAQVGTFLTSITNLMRALRMLPGDAPPRKNPWLLVSGCTFVHCTRGGVYMPSAQVGDVLDAGGVIGHVMDLYGQIVETVTVPDGPACLTGVPAPYVPVESGRMIAEAVRVRNSESEVGVDQG